MMMKKMPNHTTSMPNAPTAPASTGIMISSIDSASMNSPITSSSAATARMKAPALSTLAVMKVETSCGMRHSAIALPNTLAPAMISRIAAEVRIASATAPFSPSHVRLRSTSPVTASAPRKPMAEASVGVNQP